MKKSASKARLWSNLTGDDDKLQRRVEHFSDVVKCESEFSVATLYALPVLEPPIELSDDMCVCVNELIDNLAEVEIAAVTSQMWKGRAPGLDGMSTEWSQYQKKVTLVSLINAGEYFCWML